MQKDTPSSKKIPTPRFEPGTQQKQDWISSLLPVKKKIQA